MKPDFRLRHLCGTTFFSVFTGQREEGDGWEATSPGTAPRAADLQPLPSRGPQRPVCANSGTATDSGPKVFLNKHVVALTFLSLMPLPSEKSSLLSPRRHFTVTHR